MKISRVHYARSRGSTRRCARHTTHLDARRMQSAKYSVGSWSDIGSRDISHTAQLMSKHHSAFSTAVEGSRHHQRDSSHPYCHHIKLTKRALVFPAFLHRPSMRRVLGPNILVLEDFITKDEAAQLAADVRRLLSKRNKRIMGHFGLGEDQLPSEFAPVAERIAKVSRRQLRKDFPRVAQALGTSTDESKASSAADDAESLDLTDFVPNQVELAELPAGACLNTKIDEGQVISGYAAVLTLEGLSPWQLALDGAAEEEVVDPSLLSAKQRKKLKAQGLLSEDADGKSEAKAPDVVDFEDIKRWDLILPPGSLALFPVMDETKLKDAPLSELRSSVYPTKLQRYIDRQTTKKLYPISERDWLAAEDETQSSASESIATGIRCYSSRPTRRFYEEFVAKAAGGSATKGRSASESRSSESPATDEDNGTSGTKLIRPIPTVVKRTDIVLITFRRVCKKTLEEVTAENERRKAKEAERISYAVETEQLQHVSMDEKAAAEFERQHVHQVYDAIAGSFSETRQFPWPRIDRFLASLQPWSVLADVGCGNGKYLGTRQDILAYGCDISAGLLSICQKKGFLVAQGNALSPPFRRGTFDAAICIAVIPHLATHERRLRLCRELVGLLKPGGRAMATAWAFEQGAESKRVFEGADVFVPWVIPKERIAHAQAEGRESKSQAPKGNAGEASPSQSETGGDSQSQSQAHPRSESPSLSAQVENAAKFHRFYHVFRKGELDELFETVASERKELRESRAKLGLKLGEGGVDDYPIEIIDSFYDKSNWGVIVQKLHEER